MLHQRQLALISARLISFTQEGRNFFPTLKASVGRLSNFLGQANKGAEADKKKLVDLITTIERHHNLLNQKAWYLHRLGQRMGTPSATFDPREIIEEAILFSTRRAQLYKVSLCMEEDKTFPSFYFGAPVCLHFFVSILINNMLEQVKAGGKVIVSGRLAEKGILINVEGNGIKEPLYASDSVTGDQLLSLGQWLIAGYGGHLQASVMEQDSKRISLFLPQERVSNNYELDSNQCDSNTKYADKR